MGERCYGHRVGVGSGPGSLLSSSLTLSMLLGWELLSPGQSDWVWYLLCFLQEQGGQPAVLHQGIVLLL